MCEYGILLILNQFVLIDESAIGAKTNNIFATYELGEINSSNSIKKRRILFMSIQIDCFCFVLYENIE